MRERLALAGGRLTEAAHNGSGFQIRALVPTAESHDTGHHPRTHATENPVSENTCRTVDVAS